MKAKKLIKDDIIGVCAPSDCIKEKNIKDLETSKNRLKEFELEVEYSQNLYIKENIIEKKSEDLNNLIKNKKIKAIAFLKGGDSAINILDHIDYEEIKNNPKIFFGFSDNTALLNAIYKKTGLITYHFTNYKGLFESELDFNKNQFKQAFLKGYKGEVLHNSRWETIKKGKSNGKLIGGNLTAITKLLKTKYCPEFKNNILFIEELACEADPKQVLSMLQELKNNNVFNDISGLLIGHYDVTNNIKIEQLIMNTICEYDFPIIKCDDFGHTQTNIVLPVGINCTLDADNCKLIYEESTVD